MRVAVIDTLYDSFLRSIPFDANSTYEVELQKVLDYKFGTFDAYSRNLRALGHECMDVIFNHHDLQNMWANENYLGKCRRGEWILDLQIETFKPDVVILQDLSVHQFTKGDFLVAAQCSCRPPQSFTPPDVVFTSLPSHIKKFEALGSRAVYLPLAFDPIVLEGPQPERDIDIAFVGGLNRESHWKRGTDAMEIVAERFPGRFQWWGYGLDNLPASSALRACYRGPAWGRQQYEIYRRAKVVVNRHGEIAAGYVNNLRCFEATGCGALLMTELAPNLRDLFPSDTVVGYINPEYLCEKIEWFLSHDQARETMAVWGQNHTLNNHTYAHRMKTVSAVLQEMLVSA